MVGGNADEQSALHNSENQKTVKTLCGANGVPSLPIVWPAGSPAIQLYMAASLQFKWAVAGIKSEDSELPTYTDKFRVFRFHGVALPEHGRPEGRKRPQTRTVPKTTRRAAFGTPREIFAS